MAKYLVRLPELNEARRNPQINRGSRTYRGISDLLFYARSKSHYFATFTELPKVGINPKTEHGTPVGVYAYPLWANTIDHAIEDNFLPFAGDAPFISILRADGNLVDLSSTDFKDWNTRVVQWLADRLGHLTFGGDLVPREVLERTIWGTVYVTAGRGALSKSPAGIWWGFIRLAVAMALDAKTTHEQGRTVEGLSFVAEHVFQNIDKIKGIPAAWTRCMLDLGIDGVIDYGEGIIHNNEPTQAVLINPRIIKVVDRINNPRSKEYTRVTSPSMLVRALRIENPLAAGLYGIIEWFINPASQSYFLPVKHMSILPDSYSDGKFTDCSKYLDSIARYCQERGDDYSFAVATKIAGGVLWRYRHHRPKTDFNGIVLVDFLRKLMKGRYLPDGSDEFMFILENQAKIMKMSGEEFDVFKKEFVQ